MGTVADRVVSVIQIVCKPQQEVLPGTMRTEIAQWDSLAHVEVVLMLEEMFAIRCDAADVTRLNSVQDCIDMVQRKLDA